MRQKSFYTFGIALIIFGLISPLTTVYADTLSNLPAVPIAQRYSPPDSNGDTGLHDCMAAALTTALGILSDTGNLAVPRETIDYVHVRRMLRTHSPNPTRGIAPSFLIAVTPTLTQQAFSLVQEQVNGLSWRTFLYEELAAGRPVLVHIADRNSLYNLPHRSDAAHVVVVYGIHEESVSYTDSWDGVAHTISAAQFASAWGSGHYKWLAWHFVVNL